METLDTIDQYLKGTLTEAERITFEKRMAEDSALQEEVYIQKQLFALHGVSTKAGIKNDAYKEELQLLEEKLKSEEYQVLSRKIRAAGKAQATLQPVFKKKKKHYFFYSIAATIAVLITTFLVLNRTPSLPDYYKENTNWEELPSFTAKGEDEVAFSKGETFFKNKEYNKAIAVFETIDTTNELYPYALMYTGASYEQLNENEKALNNFDKLTQLTTFEEHSKGYWYKLLVYLKTNNTLKAKEMKAIILKDKTNYKYNKAQEVDLGS